MIGAKNMVEVNTDLIKRAQTGDAEVVTALYEQYYQDVFRYLYYRVGDRHIAEDLASEVFLRMLRFIGGFNPPSASFQSWLFQIARNLSIDYHRSRSLREHLPLNEDMPTSAYSPDHSADSHLTSEILQKALSCLNNDQRDVILMRFVAGMPIVEVARTLHKSEDAIKGLQRRGLAALKEILLEWEITYA